MSLWSTRKKIISIGIVACVIVIVCVVFVFSNAVASEGLDGVWEARWEPTFPTDHLDERERILLERFRHEALNHSGSVIRDIYGNLFINTFYHEHFRFEGRLMSGDIQGTHGNIELIYEQTFDDGYYRLYRVTSLHLIYISNDQIGIMNLNGNVFLDGRPIVFPFSRNRNTMTIGEITLTRSSRSPANRGILDGMWVSSEGGHDNRIAFFGGNFVQIIGDSIRRGTYNISNDLLELAPENGPIDVVPFSRTENTLIFQQQPGGRRVQFTRVLPPTQEEIAAGAAMMEEAMRAMRAPVAIVPAAASIIISNLRTLQSASLMFFVDHRDELQRDPAPATINGRAPDDIRNLTQYAYEPESEIWGSYEFHIIGDGPLSNRVWWVSTEVNGQDVASNLQTRRESVGLFSNAYAPENIPPQPNYAGGSRVFMLIRNPNP